MMGTKRSKSALAKRSNINVRRFRRSNLSAVKELIDNTIDICYPADYPKEAVQYFKQYHCDENILKGAKKVWTLILEKNNHIVATGTIIDDHILKFL